MDVFHLRMYPFTRSIRKYAAKLKTETVKLTPQKQKKISAECKHNPERFWQHINRKNHIYDEYSDLKWVDESENENMDKAEPLQKKFRL